MSNWNEIARMNTSLVPEMFLTNAGGQVNGIYLKPSSLKDDEKEKEYSLLICCENCGVNLDGKAMANELGNYDGIGMIEFDCLGPDGVYFLVTWRYLKARVHRFQCQRVVNSAYIAGSILAATAGAIILCKHQQQQPSTTSLVASGCSGLVVGLIISSSRWLTRLVFPL